MKIEVKFFTSLREITGKRIDKLDIQKTSTLDELINLLIEKYGKSWIRNMLYVDIMSILKTIKKNKSKYKSLKINEMIFFALEELSNNLANKPNEEQKLRRIKRIIDISPEKLGYLNFLSISILQDDDLKRCFQGDWKWSPNELAKELVAKLLDVSLDTIKNIIDRKQ